MALSRRDFVRRTCCTAASLGVASGLSRFGLINALAQNTSNYRALVCIFLFGGNDANNLLIPMDPAGYANYQNIRQPAANGGLALTQGSLLPITSKTEQVGTNSFGLHPNVPEIQSLYDSGRLAFLANVGTLVAPTTRSQYLANSPVPSNLFSHPDQQGQWQTADVASIGSTGWGGRLADILQTTLNAGSSFPPITSVAGSAIFCTGQQTQPFAIVPGSKLSLNVAGFDASAASSARLQSLQQLLTLDTGASLIQAASTITTNGLQDSQTISQALASSSRLQTVFPTSSLGVQLQQVAQILKIQSALGLTRQVFFCSLGGFDTHAEQLGAQAGLLAQLSPAMNAFYNATVELNLAQQVTTFTMSDFSRTYQPATDGGTDHAWGSVQMIMGGAVQGGDIYGTLPTFALAGPDDADVNGRWIPTTAIDQYGATLAAWFGVQPSALPAIFPNLPNFSTTSLGFLG